MAQNLPIAASEPAATINKNVTVDAGQVDVKGSSSSYDVWDDDWSK